MASRKLSFWCKFHRKHLFSNEIISSVKAERAFASKSKKVANKRYLLISEKILAGLSSVTDKITIYSISINKTLLNARESKRKMLKETGRDETEKSPPLVYNYYKIAKNWIKQNPMIGSILFYIPKSIRRSKGLTTNEEAKIETPASSEGARDTPSEDIKLGSPGSADDTLSEKVTCGIPSPSERAEGTLLEEVKFATPTLPERPNGNLSEEIAFGIPSLSERVKGALSEEVKFSTSMLSGRTENSLPEEVKFGSSAISGRAKCTLSEEVTFKTPTLLRKAEYTLSEEVNFGTPNISEKVEDTVPKEVKFRTPNLSERVEDSLLEEVEFDIPNLSRRVQDTLSEESLAAMPFLTEFLAAVTYFLANLSDNAGGFGSYMLLCKLMWTIISRVEFKVLWKYLRLIMPLFIKALAAPQSSVERVKYIARLKFLLTVQFVNELVEARRSNQKQTKAANRPRKENSS